MFQKKKPKNQHKPKTAKTPNKSKKKQNNRQTKNYQNNNIEVFPAWDFFQTKSTQINFKGPSSEKETPNQLDLIVNKCQQKKQTCWTTQ